MRQTASEFAARATIAEQDQVAPAAWRRASTTPVSALRGSGGGGKRPARRLNPVAEIGGTGMCRVNSDASSGSAAPYRIREHIAKTSKSRRSVTMPVPNVTNVGWSGLRFGLQLPSWTMFDSFLDSCMDPWRHDAPQRQTSAASERMRTFGLISPDLLRATRADVPLAWAGRMLRPPLCGGGPTNGHSSQAKAEACYAQSFVVDGIDTFWSHSWRAPPWRKILALFLYYNALPTMLLSCAAAVLGFMLTCAQILPDMVAMPWAMEEEDVHSTQHGCAVWSVVFGLVVSMIALPLGRPRESVFLDKVCIHQTDENLKRQGIESIGAVLQSSANMLVLWDQSYAKRLWCVFELAAYIRAHLCHEEAGLSGAVHVKCRPLALGTICVWLYLVTATTYVVSIVAQASGMLSMPVVMFFSGMALYVVCHRYHRNVRVLNDDFTNFRVANAGCFCCSNNHRCPQTGVELICDRQLIEECIVEWFDGLDNFESFVQRCLFYVFRRQLGRMAIPYPCLVLAGLPTMWAFFDVASPQIKAGHTEVAAAILLRGLAYWLFVFPVSVATVSTLAARTCAQGEQRAWGKWLLMMVVAGVANCWMLAGSYVCVKILSPILGPLYCACALLLLAAAVTVAVWRLGNNANSNAPAVNSPKTDPSTEGSQGSCDSPKIETCMSPAASGGNSNASRSDRGTPSEDTKHQV